jgi:hypothetical protein
MLTSKDRQLVFDFYFFHKQSPLNTATEDNWRFHQILFRAIPLNIGFTAIAGVVAYKLLFSPRTGFMGRSVRRGVGLLGVSCYCLYEGLWRFSNEFYSQEALTLARKYETEVEAYNDHYRRLYGNK